MALVRGAGRLIASILVVCMAGGCVTYYASTVTQMVRPRRLPRTSVRFRIVEVTGKTHSYNTWSVRSDGLNTVAAKAYPSLFTDGPDSIGLCVVCDVKVVPRENPVGDLGDAAMKNPITAIPAIVICVGVMVPCGILFGNTSTSEDTCEITVKLASATRHDPIQMSGHTIRSKTTKKGAPAFSPFAWLPPFGEYKARSGPHDGFFTINYLQSKSYKGYSEKIENIKSRAVVDAVARILSDMPPSQFQALGKVHYKNTFEP